MIEEWIAWITKAYQHGKIVEMGAEGLPLGSAFVGLCRIVHGMFDRAFHRKSGLHVGIECVCPSYLSQPLVLPDVNNGV